MLFVIFVSVVFLLVVPNYTHFNEKRVYRIGGLFSDPDQKVAFHLAADTMNERYNFSKIKFLADSILVPSHNSFKAYNSACKLLEKGIVGLFGPSSTHSSPYIQSLCDLREIPHIETHQDLNIERNETLVNIHPHPRILSNIFVDLIASYHWNKVTVIYDSDESLLNIVSLLDLNLPNARTVVLRQLVSDNKGSDRDYRSMLTKIKHTGKTRFLLACSIDILEEVLRQLQQVGMITESYSYIITNLDMHTIELSPFQYAGTNITGISMVDPDTIEVQQVASEFQKRISRDNTFDNDGTIAAWRFRLQTALILDAVKLFAETIYSLTNDNKMLIDSKPVHCKSHDTWAEGYTIINLMKMKTVKGLTGMVSFDTEGFRKDFDVDIIELVPGGILKVGEWNSYNRKINTIQRHYHHSNVKKKVEGIFDRTFKVLITISPPYGMLTEATTQLTGNDRYEGYCVDVIKELSAILGFNYTFIIQEDKYNGNYNKTTKEWNGMIKQIIDGKADLAIADLTITSERENAVDFTMPFMNLGISILYRKPEPVPPSLFMFASPFSLLVWAMLGVAYFIVSLAFFIMGRLSPTEWQNPYPCVEEPEHLVNQFTLRNSLWFTIGALMQQGSELAPISISTRTASGVWWFFVLIMVSSYTANLAAFLTVETLVTPFKNIKELASQTEISYGAKKDGATANYFRDSNITEYKNIWKYMMRHPQVMTRDDADSVKKVETENYAFLMESTTIEYVIERHCTLAQVGGLLDDKGYGIAMKKDSPFRNELSTAVLRLQETGVLTKLKIKWWKEKRGGGKCASKSEGGEATALDLQNVGGVFLVLFIGAILGLLGSFLELVLHIRRRAKKENVSFKEEFKKEMKFIVAFKQNVKEVNSNNSDSNDNQLINRNDNPTYGFKL